VTVTLDKTGMAASPRRNDFLLPKRTPATFLYSLHRGSGPVRHDLLLACPGEVSLSCRHGAMGAASCPGAVRALLLARDMSKRWA
jgi:hypothetical protein